MNYLTSGGFTNHNSWVLVAGTGVRWGVPQEVCLAAAAVGEAIAQFDCGLVTGGWSGVDYLAAEAFATIQRNKGNRVEDRLVQVVRQDREIEFPHGRIVRTSIGGLEWLEPQSYCDAVVLIGGLGGTYGAFLGAMNKGLPRFPLGGTGGDATQAFRNMCELWDVIPNPGITKAQFEMLGRPVATRRDAVTLAEDLMPLIINSILHRKGLTPKSVFLSYSRRDKIWMRRILEALRPVEQSGRARIWTDIDIEAGMQWDTELRRQMAVCDIAIVLVSSSFLQSEYVRNVELPVLLERARAGRTRFFWIAVSSAEWQNTELRETQAVLNPHLPLDKMNPADAQVELVRLRQTVEESVLGDPGGVERPIVGR